MIAVQRWLARARGLFSRLLLYNLIVRLTSSIVIPAHAGIHFFFGTEPGSRFHRDDNIAVAPAQAGAPSSAAS
jgi:hypothetical protein